jgi:hypothetical protein
LFETEANTVPRLQINKISRLSEISQLKTTPKSKNGGKIYPFRNQQRVARTLKESFSALRATTSKEA